MNGSTATLIIIAATCAASFLAFDNRKLLASLIFWPPAVTRDHQYWRLLSYGIVHADGSHLVFNMLTLYFFGSALAGFIDHHLGTFGFTIFYLLGLVASIVPTWLRHREDSQYYSLGASGAVTAVIFGFILLRPWSTISVFFAIPMPAIVYAALYLGYTIYMDRRKTDRVNHSAHLWGAVYGVVFLTIMDPRVIGLFLDELSHPRL